MTIEVLHTVDAVVDALGGTGAVAGLFERTSDAAVSNWRSANQLPASTYLIIRRELEKVSKTAPDSLWTMKMAAVAS